MVGTDPLVASKSGQCDLRQQQAVAERRVWYLSVQARSRRRLEKNDFDGRHELEDIEIFGRAET